MRFIKQLVQSIYLRFRKLILYGIIGSFSAGIDFLVYFILTNYVDINYLIANIFSVSIGIIISFILNRKYNFKVTDYVFRRFIIFISIGLGGLALSSLLLYVFIEYFAFEILISKLLSIIIVVLLQFLLNKFVTFKQSKITL